MEVEEQAEEEQEKEEAAVMAAPKASRSRSWAARVIGIWEGSASTRDASEAAVLPSFPFFLAPFLTFFLPMRVHCLGWKCECKREAEPT